METVTFKSIEINEGPRMKRFRPGSKGRANPYKRRMSHIKIVLTDEISENTKVTGNKLEKKIENMDIEVGNQVESGVESLESSEEKTDEQRKEKPKKKTRKEKPSL